MNKIIVYGAEWCSMTKRSLKLLDESNVEYDYIDIEKDAAAAARVREHNPDGKERKPTIEIGDQVLIEPSNQELRGALETNGFAKQS